jgi:hypothetical protein
MAAFTRSWIWQRSYAASGRSGSEGSSAAGRFDSSVWSALASGEVDSIVLMRTMVRLSRYSSEPTLAARSASDGSHPSSRRNVSRAASSSRR